MTPEQFTYWLQGYAELNATPPTTEQWQAIRDHLTLVFNKVTPNLDEQSAKRALRPPSAADVSPRWGYPPDYPSAGFISVSVDREARLLC